MLRGCYTALITPFDEHLNVDFESLERLVERQLSSGIDGLVILGTTGESPTLGDEEYERILDFFRKFAKDTRLIFGIGSNDTSKVLKKADLLKRYGFEYALVVVPYYNKPNPDGLYKHFKAVARTGLKLMLYDVPSRTGISMDTDVLSRLVDEFPESIVSLKYAHSDLDKLSRHISSLPENFSILSGDDNLTLPMLSLGAKGVVSVASNVFPKEVSELVSSALEGDYEQARRIHYKLYKAFKLLFVETNPIPVKYVLYRMGLIRTPYTRLPLGELSQNSRKLIEDELLGSYLSGNR